MSRLYLTNLDLNQNELQNVRVQNLAAAPSSPVKGQLYLNTGDNIMYWYNGAGWVSAAGGGGTGITDGDKGDIMVSGSGATWTIDASAITSAKIADGTIAVGDLLLTSVRLNTIGVPSAAVDMSSQKLTNLADGTAATDAATRQQVDAARQGISVKDPVRVATTTNGTLATAYANASVVDGITLATGDRILLKNQTTASENGIYTVNAAGAPSRAVDADLTGELVLGSAVWVNSGTQQGRWLISAVGATPWVPGTSTSTWSMDFAATSTTAGAGLSATGNVFAVGAGTGITVAADTVSFDQTYGDGRYALAAGAAKRYASGAIIGGATSQVLTHGLNTRDVTVEVYRSTTPWDTVDCDVERTSTTTITLRFAVAPATNAYSAVVFA